MEKEFLDYFSGFSKLNYESRLKKLRDYGAISHQDFLQLKSGVTSQTLAENLIENVLGYFDLPLGLAVNLVFDGKPRLIPLAVEETSIIAAASKTGKWLCTHGEIRTKTLGSLSIGQVQIAHVQNPEKLKETIASNFETWKQEVNQKLLSSMVKRGGGLQDYELRILPHPKQGHMAIWHLHIGTCDAMGANRINQVCEYLKAPLEQASGEKVNICILSNLADKQLAQAHIILRNQDKDLIHRIEEASWFAEVDPYRAATSNKGVLNGIDALMLATGNDWRAVESGLHTFASRSGKYSSLTKWRVQGSELHGYLEGPFMLGTVGGVTDLHPTARIALKILDHPSAQELSRLAAGLGLVQNLAALRALVTEGVIEGHMKLHIKNLSLKAGATEEEQFFLNQKCQQILKKEKHISLSRIQETLKVLRKERA